MQSLVTVCGLLLLCSVQAHVVRFYEDLPKDCKSFFYHDYVPEWAPSKHHVYICQFFNKEYRFTTLYDKHHRIPVYSAYIMENRETGKGTCRETWKIEPQLVDDNLDMNMMLREDVEEKYKKNVIFEKIEKSQAVFEDYKGIKGYDRGHLNAAQHHRDEACEATYTLTNAVPQYKELNCGAWAMYEKKLKAICPEKNKLFVLVGAIPSSNNWVKKDNENRVNIPDYLWHAYCCVDNNNNPVISGAAVATNAENNVVECSLQSLKEFFIKLKQTPELFKNCDTDPPQSSRRLFRGCPLVLLQGRAGLVGTHHISQVYDRMFEETVTITAK